MTLMQLRYFAAVCREGSTARAAQELHVSQSTVSLTLRRLEEETGLTLFHRGPRGLTPTEAGRFLSERAGSLLEDADRLAADLAALAQKGRTVRIALSPMTERTLWPRLRTGIAGIQPPLRVRLSITPGIPELLQRVSAGQAEAAILALREGAETPGEFESLYLGPCPRLLLCVSREHPLADRKRVSCREIADIPLISGTNDSEKGNRYLREVYARFGKEPLFVEYCSQFSTMLELIRSSRSAAYLNETVLADAPGIVGLEVEEFDAAGFYLVRPKNKKPAAAERDLLRFLRSCRPFA